MLVNRKGDGFARLRPGKPPDKSKIRLDLYRLNRTLSSAAECSRHDMSLAAQSEEKLVLGYTQELLDAIDEGDYSVYQRYCAEDLSCFEPEAVGHLVEGLRFHKYYFDAKQQQQQQQHQVKPRNQTIASPKVRLLAGGQAAVVTYVRLQQREGNGSHLTFASEETRVWEKRDGKWMHVHFHRSLPTAPPSPQ